MSVSGANFVAEILELFGALCLAWPLFRDFKARQTLARISGVLKPLKRPSVKFATALRPAP